jgi:N-acetyl-anhydromuramyl-L-alanine amidase AmpD
VGRPLGNSSVDKIVIHDTEGGWNASVATLQNDSGKSVHYIVDADGSRVGQFRPETDTTWHAGNFSYNETSIGIEHVGTAANPAGYSAELYATSRKLVKSIRTRWTVPLDRTHIIGHYQVPNGNDIAESSPPCTATLDTCETSSTYGGADNHTDPGYHWQWCQYMADLGGSCTCNDTYAMWNCTTDKTEAVRCTNGNVEIDQCNLGCEVMPVGTADVCHKILVVTPIDESGGDAGVDDPTTTHHDGGCATSDASGWLLVLVALGFIRSRRC